jgi:transcriptional regulator with XRE-family HTH domain
MMGTRKKLSDEQVEAARRLLDLWRARKEVGLTQQQAAERLGVTAATVSQYLHGFIPLGTDAMIRWATLLGVSPDEIRPDMKDAFDVLGPVTAQADGETIELSPDELEWVRMLRQLSPADRQTMRRVVAALAKPVADPRDSVAGY